MVVLIVHVEFVIKMEIGLIVYIYMEREGKWDFGIKICVKMVPHARHLNDTMTAT